jgi:hypothetical protein
MTHRKHCKCRHLKKLTCKGTLRQVCIYPSEAQNPKPPHLHTVYVYSIFIHTGKGKRGEGRVEPERRLGGQQFTKLGRKYHDMTGCISSLQTMIMWRLPVSLANLRQRVVKIYFTPPLDVTRRTQRSQNSGEQQSMSRASSS